MNDIDTEKIKKTIAAWHPMRLQIAQLLIKGYRTREIAVLLRTTLRHIRHHVTKMQMSLGTTSKQQFGFYLQIGGVE